MTPQQILENVQSRIGDFENEMNHDSLEDAVKLLEWIDRQISKVLEETE